MIKSADQAYESIRLGILNGTYKPDERLVENELAEALKASRTPIREALRRLEAEGLIEVAAHRGARVKAWTADDLRELYDLRAILEAAAGERAATRITAQDLERLAELCNEMDACVAKPNTIDRDRYSQLNALYHDIVRIASGSSRLVAMIQSVVDVPLVARTFYHYNSAEMVRSAYQHREITDALRANDEAWAGSLLLGHVLGAKNKLIERAPIS